jgi:hypothetical protein
MNTKNYACFHCQVARKGNWPYKGIDASPIAKIKCVECQRNMVFLGDKWRVPTKGDKHGWKKLIKSMREHSNPLWQKAVADMS